MQDNRAEFLGIFSEMQGTRIHNRSIMSANMRLCWLGYTGRLLKEQDSDGRTGHSKKPYMTRKQVAEHFGLSLCRVDLRVREALGPIFYSRGFHDNAARAYRLEDVEVFHPTLYDDWWRRK